MRQNKYENTLFSAFGLLEINMVLMLNESPLEKIGIFLQNISIWR